MHEVGHPDVALTLVEREEQPAGADGKVKPTLFRDQDGDMDKASCNARLEYLTKKFYRMVRNNLHEFDGMKLVKSACVDVDTFDFGSN